YEAHWFGLGLNVPQLDGSIAPMVSGLEAAKLFLTGYLVEKSLSLDNVFVISLIFGSLAVPAIYQHRVLFWGILGALVMRGVMVAVGAQLIHQYAWVPMAFGAILVLTAVKMAFMGTAPVDPATHPVLRLIRRVVPVTPDYEGPRFLSRLGGRRAVTPLFLALVLVEITDLVFALDSIPAIFAITADPFLVLTSNVFAILGLRALYFCLAGSMDRFRYLKPALIAILAFVGIKMLLVQTSFKVDPTISLLVIAGILTIAIAASAVESRRGGKAATA
ncbi:MAG TPA: TerC/Alx family metal homeostasis membrane protein, partial [Gemmatimonadales bacterium]|nr:TerC/Alx family metal homeostasis membrane protein [Gemmatimonadales bacterium]